MVPKIDRLAICEMLVDHYADHIPKLYPPLLIYHHTERHEILFYHQWQQPTLRIAVNQDIFLVDFWDEPGDQQATVRILGIEWAHPYSISCLDTLVKIFVEKRYDELRGPLQLAYLELDDAVAT